MRLGKRGRIEWLKGERNGGKEEVNHFQKKYQEDIEEYRKRFQKSMNG